MLKHRVSSHPPTYSAVTIALGQYYTCVIVTTGGVKCWGNNDYGQLGIGDSSQRYSPVIVNGGMTPVFILIVCMAL